MVDLHQLSIPLHNLLLTRIITHTQYQRCLCTIHLISEPPLVILHARLGWIERLTLQVGSHSSHGTVRLTDEVAGGEDDDGGDDELSERTAGLQ